MKEIETWEGLEVISEILEVDEFNNVLQMRRQIEGAPFDILFNKLPNVLGWEITLETHGLISTQVKNIYFGAYFEQCQPVFVLYLDFRDWPSKWHLSRYNHTIKLHMPRVCLSDILEYFSVSIPFVSMCIYLDDLIVFPNGISAEIKMDFAVSAVSGFLGWKRDGIPVWPFVIGQLPKCHEHYDHTECLAESGSGYGCGWCEEFDKCLIRRSDGYSSDVCRSCNRCNFYISTNKKSECISKEACGWCNQDSKCYPGDKYGPFSDTNKCAPVYSRDVEGNIKGAVASSSWKYEPTYSTTTVISIGLISGLCGVLLFSLLIGSIIMIFVLSHYIRVKGKDGKEDKTSGLWDKSIRELFCGCCGKKENDDHKYKRLNENLK